MKNNLLGLSVVITGFIALSACTKSIPYKELGPDEQEKIVSKALLDQKSEYIYSTSMQAASRSSADALPFSSGDNRRVKIEITQEFLRIVETERDARYAGNKNNDKTLLQIPIRHVNIQCAKDRFGDCRNEQEAGTDLPWNQRGSIQVDFSKAVIGELDLLPIAISQTLGENCYKQIGDARVVLSKIEDDAINFQVERQFLANLECLGNVDTLTDANVKAVYHYSLVKADRILTKGFKPVSYPEGSVDEGTFGFFTSKRTKLDVDNNKTTTSSVQLMNHWNPNRDEIIYHLSDEFAKPENKQIRDLTYQTVNNLNKGLEESGVKFRVKLQDPSGKVPGDIRNSMIVLVEDPVASSIIGYGPQTEDPITGEIISARTVMFLGTIKKFIKNTYEEIRLAKQIASQETASEKDGAGGKASPSSRLRLSSALSQQMANAKRSNKVFNAQVLNTKIQQLSAVKSSSLTTAKSLVANENLRNAVTKYTKNVNPALVGNDLKSQIRYLHYHKNCAFEPAMENSIDGISAKLANQFPSDAKPWTELSEDEKNQVVAKVLPSIWVPTLIHEMGHNLGLRHNFAASEDKANFLTDAELKAHDIDHKIPFSSVMDYGDDLKALPYLGKYDIAALRFGYLRQVEVQSAAGATLQPVVDSLEAMKRKAGSLTLKEYKYCTDEHTGINAGCKRFDLGTSYTEIAQNLIKDYETLYTRRNFRNGNANMSLMDDLAYASRVNSIFKELRLMLEVRERIKYQYNMADSAKEWNEIDFLKDLHQATVLGGSFLTKVLLTPDQMCAIAEKANPGEVAQVVRLEDLDSNAISCWKVRLNDKYMVVAQGGKSFNSKKDPESQNNYADQIDVRGVWIDKVLAIRTLFNRNTGIFNLDKNTDHFMDIAELREPTLKAVQGLLKNNVIDSVTFTMADGSKADIQMRYDQFTSQMIARPLNPATARALGIHGDRATQLQEALVNGFVSNMFDATGAHSQDEALGLALSVNRYALSQTGFDASAKQVVSGNVRYVADSTNTVAASIIEEIALSRTLEKVSSEKLTEILAAKTASKAMPMDASEDEKAIWALPTETIQFFQGDLIKSSAFNLRLLQLLPSVKN